jgi:hypothetical protein
MRRTFGTSCGPVLSMVVCVVIIMVVAAHTAAGEDDTPVTFRIAPPPVGYPVFEPGIRHVGLGANGTFLTVKMLDTPMHLYGGAAFATLQQCFNDSFTFSGSVAGALLMGDEYDLMLTQIPVNVFGLFQAAKHERGTLFLFGGAGSDIGITIMTVTIPQPVPLTTRIIKDETQVSTTVLTVTGNGGGQINVPAGDFIVSLFGVYHFTGGSYSTTQTSSMSYSYPSTSGTIEGVSAVSLGCDLLYTPLNLALSSQVQNSDRYTLITVALKWLLSRSGTEK